ncbi:aldehyde dehydrogenase family protein [Lentzea flava]|uniref:Aldehyde dehydrogenase n=1 Tax=Lentzea flava TaxID=103732 RepID=A0ABQ2UFZ0_9PSEU|nr:aldehyde dehydrogenase family protein [Lentzea flava]MCP2198276.1 NADP-dependent aldehyde dehydrogenase [Lentzea flava]GGU31420.1 aldehyde dehydrogenase [Lentzea flava]
MEEVLDRAAQAAREWGGTSPDDRAAALDAVAGALDRESAELVALAEWECRLPGDRLRAEVGRTTFQLRSFAEYLRSGAVNGVVIDHEDVHWPPGPRPDLRRMLVPLGPVAVFGSTSYPFAFSVAGSDTASALAAGCPVVVKASHSYPDLADRTAEVVEEVLPKGVFALVHGRRCARQLVLDPRIKAVAFIGSSRVGRELHHLAATRPEPIPFYGGFGSVNPVFVTPRAVAKRGGEIARGFAQALSQQSGQLCTKPGLLVVPEGFAGDVAAEVRALRAEPLFNKLVAKRFETGVEALSAFLDVLVEGGPGAGGHAPTLLRTTAADILAGHDEALDECFGPVSVVATYRDSNELLELAAALPGQLTATVQGEDDDVLPELVAELTGRAGRVVWNQWPNDIATTPAMHHGGPWPATTSPFHTSVGVRAVERFQRPVVFQGFPSHLLPEVLEDNR